ncbi:MAG: hypothetical protein ACE3JN_10090 [Ectobacillus sp.]
MLSWNERRRLQREKRTGPACGKRPPVVENQQSSLIEPKDKGAFLFRPCHNALVCGRVFL